MKKSLTFFLFIVMYLLAGCGGSEDGTTTPTYTIGGTVSGLEGSGLVLQNNVSDNLGISTDGIFTFATALADNSSYSVTVLTQPNSPNQTCAVTNGGGSLAGANVSNVIVNCVTNTYIIGGTMTGLIGSGLVLQNNGGDDLNISGNGSFSFVTALVDNSTYNVTVLSQPSSPSQICAVSNGSGIVSGTDVTDITLNCILVEPPPINVTGNSLFCDSVAPTSTAAAGLKVEFPDSIPAINISNDPVHPGNPSWLNHNASNNLKRLAAMVTGQLPDGAQAMDPGLDGIPGTVDDVPLGDVHPLIVSYGEQVIGEFEGGDGDADIGDPDNIDDIFTSLSLDNGNTWKKVKVGDTANKASIVATWGGVRLPYPGHSHKPTMLIQGNNILVAWNDKYCPSGNPFDLSDTATEDYYKVNGSQGSIDYGGIVAPNGKILYEVPFSCVWTARGVFDQNDVDSDGMFEIQWREARQLTSGTRDSNRIWIAPAEVGFAIAWQEDPLGLLSGNGLGVGEGYTGATTNEGADIWYTYITMNDFDDVCTDATCTTTTDDPAVIAALAEKPRPAVNFTYPVRITNNEICTPTDTKLYCTNHCISTVVLPGDPIAYCIQSDLDYMTPDATIAPGLAVLNGDTGASLPTLKILKTNAATPEYVAVLAYEETKGLSESDPPDPDNIALEGKSVYFESFLWDQPVAVSAGRIVNLRVPEADVADDGTVTLTGKEIYENARRVVIMNQVDACEMTNTDPTFALMYQQGYAIQGGPSDMFIRVNTGFTYDDFTALDGREATNVSSHDNTDINGMGSVIWDATWLDTQSYDNAFDNTFSPRGWLRGGDVYTGFEYSPLWRATSVGTVPNNFWLHRYVNSAWQGPKQVSIVLGAKVSTLDPWFVPTPKGSNTILVSDQSNPEVLFLSYGTYDMLTGEELDLFYTRSTDKGASWEYIDGAENLVVTDAGPDGIPGTADDTAARLSRLATRADVHEMEVQGLASPDGTMLFNAWLQETAIYTGDLWSGMESWFGLINYDTLAP